MIKKLPAFTLIEILVASTIFMVVAVSSVAAFALTKRSNEKTNDLMISSDCSRQVEDFISSIIRSASKDDRIKGLTLDITGKYSAETLQDAPKAFVGIIAFQEGNNGTTAIVRRDEGYFFERTTSEAALIQDINNTNSTNLAILNSNDCRPSADSLNGLKVFKAQALNTLRSRPEGYLVEVDDGFFRVLDAAQVDASYSKVSVEAVNTRRSL